MSHWKEAHVQDENKWNAWYNSKLNEIIRVIEGQYYIVDTNSVNHTYVDGQQIPGNAKTIIHFGAK